MFTSARAFSFLLTFHSGFCLHCPDIVSEEHAGGDAYAEMTDSATSTDFTVRDGRTFMSYRKPSHGTVSGRVRREINGSWVTSEAGGHDLDTSFGPVNFLGA